MLLQQLHDLLLAFQFSASIDRWIWNLGGLDSFTMAEVKRHIDKVILLALTISRGKLTFFIGVFV